MAECDNECGSGLQGQYNHNSFTINILIQHTLCCA